MKHKPGKRRDDHYASFSRRMWAATVDSLLILFFILPFFEMAFSVIYPIPDMRSVELDQQLAQQTDGLAVMQIMLQHFYATGFFARWLVDMALQTLLLCALTAYCWRRWAATPGKILFRIKVVDATTEQPIADRQILLRLFGYFISSVPLLLGFFWISFNKRRQGWHDKIADTVVIRVPKKVKSDSEAVHP